MSGKLIVIEGTDCSGKETQAKLLVDRLNNNNISAYFYSFPAYDTPTGKIIGGPYLGKKSICDGFFEEGAPKVDAKVSSLYYAADRLYNIDKILDKLAGGTNVILDRYTYSNMAHQACKIKEKEARKEMYEWLEELEFEFLRLPIPDIRIFLHMPHEKTKLMKAKREEVTDQNEQDDDYLALAEKAYLELSLKYDFKIIECVEMNEIKSISLINDELFEYLKSIKII